MVLVKYEFNDLTEEEYAAIGRVVRTFGAIEHELARTLIDAKGGIDIPFDKDIKRAMRGSIVIRLQELIKILESMSNAIEPDWLEDFKTKLLEGCQLRNHYCHGFWYKDENGKLWCDFFRRADEDGVNNDTGVQLDQLPCSLDQIETTFQSNLHNLTVLEELQTQLQETS